MPNRVRSLTADNIEKVLSDYVASAEEIGDSIAGYSGIKLLEALKREAVGSGPYPNVAMFEAANRIMTDLVMLYGVRWLLKRGGLPFASYHVEYGHENNNAHDVTATENNLIFAGEVFNVAPSFYPIKKSSALKKLRSGKRVPDVKMLIVNHDAVGNDYSPRLSAGEAILLVKVGTDEAILMPSRNKTDPDCHA